MRHVNGLMEKILAGEALADTRFDITTTLCKLRDLFSRHWHVRHSGWHRKCCIFRAPTGI